MPSPLALLVVEARLVVEGDRAAAAERIAANETLFRAGLVYDTVMFASVIALAWALFVILGASTATAPCWRCCGAWRRPSSAPSPCCSVC